MDEYVVHLNLDPKTPNLPSMFWFYALMPDDNYLEDGKQFHFIDGETKLNGVRTIKLASKAQPGKQCTFEAYIPE